MKTQPRKWTTALRVEQRYGVSRYVVEFSNGHLSASLYGTLGPLAATPSTLKQAAWESACEWFSHVQATNRQPLRPVRRAHFPGNRQHRKHHGFGRRVAA